MMSINRTYIYAGDGCVGYDIAHEAPDLEFIIQDLAQPTSAVIEGEGVLSSGWLVLWRPIRLEQMRVSW